MSSLANPSTAARGFWRLVWKEVRQYRAVVLTLLGTGLLLQTLFLTFQFGSLPILLVAGVFPVMCGLAIAGTAFAGEHDNATYFGLRALPATRRGILIAKLTVAAGSALLVYALLWLMVLVFREQLIGPHEYVADHSETGEWVFSSLAMVAEVLVYGALLSLIERNALVAVVKTIAVLFFVRLVSFAIAYVGVGAWVGFNPQFHSAGEASDAVFVGSHLLRVVFLAAGIALMLRAAERWFVGERLAIWPGLQRWREEAPPQSYTAAQTAPGIWRRLGWLQIRYFGWIGLAILGAALGVFLWERSIAAEDTVSTRRHIIRPEWSISLAVLASVLIGGLTFRAAQARKQLLAQLGVESWRVWLSQLLLPAVVCVLLVALFASVFPTVVSDVNWSDGFFWGFAVFLFSFFTWGQLCSQQSRSTLPALAWSGVAAVLVGFAYYGLYLLSFDSPAWQRWGAVALAAYPLLESFLRSPKWIAGTGSHVWRWIGIRTAVFTLLAAGLLWKFETEIPYISDEQIGLAQNDGVRPDTSQFEEIVAAGRQLEISRREINSRIRAAHPNVDVSSTELNSDMDAAWYKAREKKLDWILGLPYHNFGAQALFMENVGWGERRFINEGTPYLIQYFLRIALKQVIDAGNVELAERIIRKELFQLDPVLIARWAWLEGNDASRIRNLIRFIQTDLAPRRAAIWHQSGVHQLPIPTGVAHQFSRNPWMWLRDVVVVPRENRDLRKRAYEVPLVVAEFERAVVAGAGMYEWYAERESTQVSEQRAMPRDDRAGKLYVGNVCTQRFVALQLAAIAWQREHPGSVLESLEQLVPEYFAEIPRDPYTGEMPIFERSFRIQVYPESAWREAPSPTSGSFLYSPGGFGFERIQSLTYAWQRDARFASAKPVVAWGYGDNHKFTFWLNNTNSSAVSMLPKSTTPGDGLSRLFPIELTEPKSEQDSPAGNTTSENYP